MRKGEGKNRSSHAGRWVALVVFILLLPAILFPFLPIFAPILPEVDLTIDLSTNLTAEAASLFTNRTVTAHLVLDAAPEGGLLLTARGYALDWPYTLEIHADYSVLDLEGHGFFNLSLDGTAWVLDGRFAATPRTYRADVNLRRTAFDAKERPLADILSRLPLSGVSNLVFSGETEFSAHAEKTREIPVVAWSARGCFRNLAASADVGEMPINMRGVSATFGAEGIADRVTISPAYLRLDSAEAGEFAFTSASAAIRKTETGFLVTEAGTGFCGGEVKLYSLYLNPSSLTAGFTLFLDNIDANEVVKHVSGVEGEASGRLHGKIPLFLKDGKQIRLRDAYLYSTPGETGSLRLSDTEVIVGNLAASGVDASTCDNLAKALANLVYNVLKIDLRRDANGSLALTFHIDGSASHGGVTVPVSFQVTFHGDIEELINTGLKIGTSK